MCKYILSNPTIVAAIIGVTGTFLTVYIGYRNTNLKRKKKEEAINFLNKKREAVAEFLALCRQYKKSNQKEGENELKLMKVYYFLKLTYGKHDSYIQQSIDKVFENRDSDNTDNLSELAKQVEKDCRKEWEKMR